MRKAANAVKSIGQQASGGIFERWEHEKFRHNERSRVVRQPL